MYLQDGRRFHSDLLYEEYETFDTKQRVSFALRFNLHCSYAHRGGGTNGCSFEHANYTESGWEIDWFE